jgi:Chaperone of endosialidase
MSQSGFTPIQLYYSTTASTAPSAGNLANGELAINITDGKLFYKDNGGVVQVLATKGAGTIGGATTQVQYNNAGTLAGSANMTFDGTTLTLGANPVLSGGTANGVAYLNGSKVLTTGSALTFDGAQFTTVGSNTNAIKLHTENTQSGALIEFIAGGSTGYGIGGWDGSGIVEATGGASGTKALVLSAYNGPILFQINGRTEGMRLTSTGLGIGTSSPAYKLDVYGSSGNMAQLYQNDGTYNRRLITTIAATGANLGVTLNATSSVGNDNLIFQVSSVERMRIDSAGNLGLGVTPSAWASFYRGFDVSSFGAFYSATINNAGFVNNGYFNGTNWIYKNSSNAATNYQQTGGAHQWFTAPSGTAGNAISFTQAMTLDASGNLLLGTTALALSNTNSALIQTSGATCALILQHSSGNASGTAYELFAYNGTQIGSITQSGTTAVLYNVTSDQRLKENIADAPEFGTVIDSLQVRSYDWITDKTHQRAGFIAQELVTVAPEAVHQPEDPEEMMAVDYSKLVPMLVKEIQSLRKRLAAAGI